jgi:hypothetical protein
MPQTSVSTSGSGDKIIIDQATTDLTGVFDYELFVSGASTIIIKDEAANVFGTYILGAAGEIKAVFNGSERFTAKGDVIMNSSGGVTVTGHITWASKMK